MAFHETVLDEILQERVAPRRNRRNPRGVKRKMSNVPLRPRDQPPPPSFNPVDAIEIVKSTVLRLAVGPVEGDSPEA